MIHPATQTWSDAQLDAARQIGDPEVDRLVEEVLGPRLTFSGAGRLGYNGVLEIFDRLLESPNSTAGISAEVQQLLNAYPRSLTAYFSPIEAPGWVDEEKLALASRVWHENTLGILGVLYAASLPYCYLMANGIPSLYRTRHLLERRYLSQRIYQTGLMIDRVMSESGFTLTVDGTTQTRYISGRGLLAARKVRFLHATMRFMLMRPELFPPRGDPGDPARLADELSQRETSWPKHELGVPINQEDLAFTLLTFGYVIPVGLGRWGCRLSLREREAFFHCWKLVGCVMGVETALLANSAQDAGRLFETIRRRQARPSRPGKELAEALLRFVEDYVPHLFGMQRALPPILVIDQLGKETAAMILSADRRRMAGRPAMVAIFQAVRGAVWIYFLIRNRVFQRFPAAAGFMGAVFHGAGEAFINSWRDAYQSEVVSVAGKTGHQPIKPDESFMRGLAAWRRRLFYALAAGVACLVTAVIALLLGPLLYIVGAGHAAVVVAGGGAACLLLGFMIVKFAVGAVARSRPRIQ